MKSSHWWYVFFFLLGGIAIVAAQNMLFVKATAQQPAADVPRVPQPQGIQVDSRGVTELRGDGTIVQRTVDGRILQSFPNELTPAEHGAVAYPRTSAGGQNYYVVGSQTDPETARLMTEELQATQAAQKAAAEFRAAESDGDKEKLKTQLRDRLAAIFDLQQKRRAAEVAKIEERLSKLKDTMKKRETSKDAIVDRRLELLTGGVDELGWEETFPLGGPSGNSFRTLNVVPYGPPALDPPAPTVPRPANVPTLPLPGAGPPAAPAVPALPGILPSPTPPPVAPRAENELPPATTAAPRR